jgi:hypothetical protein
MPLLRNKVKLYRDSNLYQIDTVILSQLYDSLSLSDRKNYYKTVKPRKIDLKGRFSKKEYRRILFNSERISCRFMDSEKMNFHQSLIRSVLPK